MILDRNFLLRKHPDLLHLKSLELDNNYITDIEPDTFHGLSNLRIIRLENNRILEIHQDTFNGYFKAILFPKI